MVKDDLNKLSELFAERDYLVIQKSALMREAMPVEVKQKMDDIDAEFFSKLETITENIYNMEKGIKESVLSIGEAAKGAFLQAVFIKGRVSWDTKGLDGYAVAHPEILVFKKTGEPSVSIKRV